MIKIVSNRVAEVAEKIAEDFKRLKSGERHQKLLPLCIWTCRAGHTGQDLRDHITSIYNAAVANTGGEVDENDIENTCAHAEQIAAEEGDFTPGEPNKREVGRPVEISEETRKRYEKWMANILATQQDAFGASEDDLKTCRSSEAERYRLQREAFSKIIGSSVFPEKTYYFFGGKRTDKSTRSFQGMLGPGIELFYAEQADEFYCPNPLNRMERTLEACKRVDYVLLEIDGELIPTGTDPGSSEWLEKCYVQQGKFWSHVIENKLLPIRSIVHSGNKSFQVLIPLKNCQPTDLAAKGGNPIRAKLKRDFALLKLDPANLDPVRKTRAPWGARVLDNERMMYQTLEYLDEKAEAITPDELHEKLSKIIAEFDAGTDAEKAGKIPFNEANFEAFLDEIGAKIWTDEITRQPQCNGFRLNELNVLMPEIMERWHETTGGTVGRDTVKMYVDRLLAKHKTNPVLEWVHSRPWDRVDRLDAVINTLGRQPELARTLIRKWLIQTCAMLHNGEGGRRFGSEGVLTLIGKQGIGKTSFFKKLVPVDKIGEWMLEGAALDVENKDSLLQLTQYWILELGEVDDTTRRDQSRIKAVITAATDHLRQPFHEYAETTLRHCSICASVNKEDYLRDTTGNRRWWSVRVEKVDYNALDAIDMQQFWAQIEQIWQTSDQARQDCFRLTEAERNQLEAVNQTCIADAGWEDNIDGNRELAKLPNECKLSDILQVLWDKPFAPDQKTRVAIGRSLENSGWQKSRRKTGWIWQKPIRHENDEMPF